MQQLGQDYKFPSPKSATKEGIVAIGGDLNPLRILQAYQNKQIICKSDLTI